MAPVTAHPLLKDEHAGISSAAAEIYAAATAVSGILMMQSVCDEMGIGFQLPFILQVDNQAALRHLVQPCSTILVPPGFEGTFLT